MVNRGDSSSLGTSEASISAYSIGITPTGDRAFEFLK